MHRHVPVLAALLLSVSLFLTGCSQSEYEKCKDAATKEWEDFRHDLIDSGGGDDDSIKDMYLQLEGHVIDECGTGPS